jgi:endonuclease YncB( thermonuclease family)
MFGWRRRSEGFEWKEHVRTTILVRRAGRQRRLDDAQMAALAKVKDARDSALEAGKAGIEDARNWLWTLICALADTAWLAIKSAASTAGQMTRAGFARAREQLTHLPLPAMPAKAKFPDLKAACSQLYLNLRTIPRLGLLSVENVVKAAALGLVVFVGGRMLSPAPTSLTAAPQLITASIDASEPTQAPAEELTGRASAIAGDILRVDGAVVRLKGVEAPDARQLCTKTNGRRWPCGQDAKDGLARLVRGKTVTCNTSGTDDQGRPIAVCATGNGEVAAELVRRGHVFAEPGIFRAFASEEDAARAAKAGLWQGTAERPAEWRQRLWNEAKQQAPDGCPIKGFVRGSGRTYALPWSNDYQSGKLRTIKGERWFCTEEEARAAGFKPSMRS